MTTINGQANKDVEVISSKKPKNLHLPRTCLASVESLTVPLVQEVVILADFQCEKCRKRVGDIITKTNGETESVVISVLEKKVALTFTNNQSNPNTIKTAPINHVPVRLKPLDKVALIRWLFRSSSNN